MAQLAEVFEIESERHEPEQWRQIHLFKMGDFWRAYEWSAWIIATVTYNEAVRMATKDRRPLHVTRMQRTDIDETYSFVGFPIKSMEKYIPERENFESQSDKHVIITIPLPPPTDESALTEERLTSDMEEWKESIPITDKKQKKDKVPQTPSVQPATQPTGGIISQIIAYPLSERTAIDNIQFIQSLKQQIVSVL